MSLEYLVLIDQMVKDREASKEALDRFVATLQDRLGFRLTPQDIEFIFEPYKKAVEQEHWTNDRAEMPE